LVASKSMKNITEEEIEYTSEFQCPKCSTQYEISKKDGKDIIIRIGEE